MECRIIRYGEKDEVAARHPELCDFDASLAVPPFPENPVASDPDFPFLFYYIENGEILGSRRAIPDIVKRDDEAYSLAWCYDTIVTPSARGKGIGTKLVSVQVDEFERRNQISAAAFSAAAMMRIYQKLGYVVLGFVPRFALVRDASPFIQQKMGNAVVSRVASIPVNLALSAKAKARGTRRLAGVSMMAIDKPMWTKFSPQISTPQSTYHWDDDAAWSVARLQPDDQCYSLQSDEDGRVIALFAMRDRKPAADAKGGAITRLSLVHYEYDGSPETASALVNALARLLYSAKASVADLITSDPLLQSALVRLGFSRREEGMTFVFKEPSGINLPEASEQSDWKLTHFCSDGFLFK